MVGYGCLPERQLLISLNMGGGYSAKINLFSLERSPAIGFSLSDDEPWVTIDRLVNVLSEQAEGHLTTELMMMGGWPNEYLFERLLGLFQGAHGSSDKMPENEENCFFTVFSPQQVRLVLADIVKVLGPNGSQDEVDDSNVLDIVRFLSQAAMRDRYIACTFCNPP